MSAAAALIESPSFLGVEASVTGRRWSTRCADLEADRAIARMVQAHALPELLARVLAGRGVRPDEAEAFLAPRLRELMPDPSVLLDMELATDRLARAVRDGETVAVFGDYDVDGAASAAMLAEYLRGLGLGVRIHIPDRIAEGYGPNEGAIASLQAEVRPSSSASTAARVATAPWSRPPATVSTSSSSITTPPRRCCRRSTRW